LVKRNALAEFLGQAQASGILGPGQPQRIMEQSVWGDPMLSQLASVCRLAGKSTGERGMRRREFLKLYGKLASDGG
jgi:hypothetical protein